MSINSWRSHAIWASVFGSALLWFISCGRNQAPNASLEASEARLRTMVDEIREALSAAEKNASDLSEEVGKVLSNLKGNAAQADKSSYRLEPNGVLHRPDSIKLDVPAVFVSGAVPVDDRVMDQVLGTEPLDPVLKRMVSGSAMVAQAYFNDENSYNRIYPPFDVLSQYPPGMVIPSYNFYYLADTKHNPKRKVVWVRDPYVDPAGRGWMISCIAPVYHENRLVGVSGIDITTDTIVKKLDFEGKNKHCLLVAYNGMVVITGEPLIQVLRLSPLKNHRYVDTVRSDTFRADDYNVLKSRSENVRTMAYQILKQRLNQTHLTADDGHWLVRSVRLPALEWHLLEFSKL